MIVDENKTKPWSENEYWENKDMKKYNDESGKSYWNHEFKKTE